MMNKIISILAVGDIVGQAGKYVLSETLDEIQKEYDVDFTIVNGENIAGGKGITANLASKLFFFGADVITTGNHIWKNKDILKIIDQEKKLLRPLNFPEGNPGFGYGIYEVRNLPAIAVINLMGRLNLLDIDCPFKAMQNLFKNTPELEKIPIKIIDFHAETTSEKIAMGWFLDGKASLVFGTHTHVATADERVLPEGTAYISDIGMTGPHDSVLGVEKENIIKHFMTMQPVPFKIATGGLQLNAIVVQIDANTGKALSIKRIKKNVRN